MLTARHYILTYLVSLPIFLGIDMLWIGVIARGFYHDHFGDLLSGVVILPVAISFYFIFLIGIMFFAVRPALVVKSLLHAVLLGGLFGFFAYVAYDFTNWATLRGWSAILSVVDIAWGTFLSGTVAGISYWIATRYIIRP